MDFTLYEHLSENAQQFLCFHATRTLASGKRMTEVWYTLKRYCFPQFNGTAALMELKSCGIMRDMGRDWYSNTDIIRLDDSHIAPVLLYAYTRRRDLLDKYAATTIKPDNEHLELRRALRLYADTKFADASKAFTLYDTQAGLLVSLAHEADMTPFFTNLSQRALIALCQKTVGTWVESDRLHPTTPLARAVKHSTQLTELQRTRMLALLDLYTYIAQGLTPTEGVYQNVPEGQLHMALMLAKAGKHEAAAALFHKLLAVSDMSLCAEGLYTLSVLNVFYTLCLMHTGTADSRAQLKAYALRLQPTRAGDIAAIVLAADHLKANPDDVQYHLDSMTRESKNSRRHKLLACYAYLITAYFGRSTLSLDAQAATPGMALLRHEMSPWLDTVTPDERQRLDMLYGVHLVLQSIPRKAEWQNVLDDLTAEMSGKVSADNTPDDVRIMYVRHSMHSADIEPREQHRLKNGSWGSGKVISQQRYFNSDLPGMNDADRRIRNRAKSARYMRIELSDCIEELIGSDRLYFGSHAPFEPVKVERDTPYLMVEKEGSHFTVKSNVTLHALRTEPVVVEDTPTHYSVLTLSEQERSWYQKLLSVGAFPLEAEDSLRSFLPTIGGHIEVHSSLIEGGSTLPIIDGSSAIAIKLTPRNGGNHDIGIHVAPLPGGRRSCTPGQGDDIIIDESGETGRVRVRRNFAAELANLEAIAPLWREAGYNLDTDTDDYPPEFVLDLIQFIQSHPDTCYAEWPEGQTLRLRRVARGATSWSGVVKAHGEWFEVEGDIHIDDKTVVSIAQLLELVSQSHGRYLRMSDGEYLALSEKLQRQLRSLAAIANRDHGHMRISPFSAALMSGELLNGEITLALDKKIRETQERILASSEYSPDVPAGLTATLRPYQVDGYQWMARLNSWGAGALLADDMGLGKTVQTIAFLLLKKDEGPSLVVAPASVAPNWKTEIEKFAPTLHCEILNFAPNRRKVIDQAKAGDVVITTYGILLSIQDHITSKHWTVACLDEAHIIKNRGAKTSAAAMKIQAANRVMLTGTPLQNHLGELWSLFQFVNPGMLGGYENFHQKFILPIEADHNKERQEQLDRIVRPFMLRRTKQAVLKELPDKTEIYQPVALSQEELAVYESIRKRAEQMLRDHMASGKKGSEVDMHVLAEITRLRQAACSPRLIEPKWTGACSKITSLVELLQGIIEGDNRALVFSQFVSFFDIVRRELDQLGIPYLYIDGAVPVKRRSELVEQFQSGACPVFLISLKAGGLGLNLTGANYVIHLDPWWNPAVEQQATDRAYRIGQRQAVTVYHLVSQNTIEEKIIRLHQTKRDLADSLLEGTDVSHRLTGKELLDMLRQ